MGMISNGIHSFSPFHWEPFPGCTSLINSDLAVELLVCDAIFWIFSESLYFASHIGKYRADGRESRMGQIPITSFWMAELADWWKLWNVDCYCQVPNNRSVRSNCQTGITFLSWRLQSLFFLSFPLHISILKLSVATFSFLKCVHLYCISCLF